MAAAADKYIAAIDQGTTSTRCLIFNHDGRIVGRGQIEHQQILPRAGWVEHDPKEIWTNTRAVVALALADADLRPDDIAAVGVTNQRETTVVWERATGKPIANAIVWQDTRTAELCAKLAGSEGPDRYARKTGLPISTYFAGPKVSWLLDSVPGARERAENGELCFGTMDSWLIWQLTDGTEHITDVTNASRTLLMNIETLQWDSDLCEAIGVPELMLPRIVSSSEVYGHVRGGGVLAGVPIAGILGDQQAAMFGQTCFSVGDAKNTYGTGNFVLLNTGTRPVFSDHGLLTTVCYQLGADEAVYALEGSIAVTGSLIQWLRDNLGILEQAKDVEALAKSVDDNGGAYVVPAFSGLFAPRWRSDARGAIVGLTRYVTKAHLARASLESVAFQTREVIDAMNADSSVALRELRVDGGMVANNLLMQIQADQLGVPVTRPAIGETTVLGAAYAAGLAVGYWADLDELRGHWRADRTWSPEIGDEERAAAFAQWNKAVERTLDWE